MGRPVPAIQTGEEIVTAAAKPFLQEELSSAIASFCLETAV
jgi:hypothetical protein